MGMFKIWNSNAIQQTAAVYIVDNSKWQRKNLDEGVRRTNGLSQAQTEPCAMQRYGNLL
jgi:hypothetical protein